METSGTAFAESIFAAVAIDPFSLIWQILAAIAFSGLILIVIFAIIEPGPLVKKRPFPRKQRSTQPTGEKGDAAESDGVGSPSENVDSSGR